MRESALASKLVGERSVRPSECIPFLCMDWMQIPREFGIIHRFHAESASKKLCAHVLGGGKRPFFLILDNPFKHVIFPTIYNRFVHQQNAEFLIFMKFPSTSLFYQGSKREFKWWFSIKGAIDVEYRWMSTDLSGKGQLIPRGKTYQVYWILTCLFLVAAHTFHTDGCQMNLAISAGPSH